MEHSLQLFMQQMLFHPLLDNSQVILLYHQIHLISLLNKQHQLVQINLISEQLLLNLVNIIEHMEHSTHLYISKIQKNQLMEINLHLCKLNIIKKIHSIQQLIEIIHISIISHNIKMIQKIHSKMIVMNTVIQMMNEKRKFDARNKEIIQDLLQFFLKGLLFFDFILSSIYFIQLIL